jgi:hypothetical protein
MEGLEEEPSRAAADVLRLIPVQCGVCVCVWVLEAARVFFPPLRIALSLSLEWTVQERERDQKPTNLVASRANREDKGAGGQGDSAFAASTSIAVR